MNALSTRRTMVAGNWKMNGSLSGAAELVGGIVSGVSADCAVDVVVCPPFPYLAGVADQLGNASAVALGAQNLDVHGSGAYTGEVAGPMLRDCGCQYVIVGHSERRTLFGESDGDVALKSAAALANDLKPIICIGETLGERDGDRTFKVIERQLRSVVAEIGVEALANSVVAYEPVWAIGTGETATPEMAQDVHRFTRSIIEDLNADVAQGLQILYGGSMKGSNAAGLLAQPDIDGGLIGGAALEAGAFLEIINAA